MKKLFAIPTSVALYLTNAPLAFAQGTPIDPCAASDSKFNVLCELNAGQFGKLVGTAITAVFVIAVIIALIYLIYGGVRWIMSQGDKSKVQEARSHIIAAVLGLIIVFLAYFIINIILGVFLGISIDQIELPNLKDAIK
ncbi:MAG: hypothetical protein V1697_00510 [Candidatus Levyibacteriota bacterium]